MHIDRLRLMLMIAKLDDERTQKILHRIERALDEKYPKREENTRTIEVAYWLAAGDTTGQVAERLDVHERTIRPDLALLREAYEVLEAPGRLADQPNSKSDTGAPVSPDLRLVGGSSA
jgi:hypothetical protein